MMPAHSSGAAFSLSRASGIGMTKRAGTRTASAKPPLRWTQVGCACGHRFSLPRRHHAHWPQLPACQPYANALPWLKILDGRAHGLYRANDFMARNERIFADLPVIVDQVQIAAANAAVADTYIHLVCAQCPDFIPVSKQLGPGSMCRIASDLWHRSSRSLWRSWFAEPAAFRFHTKRECHLLHLDRDHLIAGYHCVHGD